MKDLKNLIDEEEIYEILMRYQNSKDRRNFLLEMAKNNKRFTIYFIENISNGMLKYDSIVKPFYAENKIYNILGDLGDFKSEYIDYYEIANLINKKKDNFQLNTADKLYNSFRTICQLYHIKLIHFLDGNSIISNYHETFALLRDYKDIKILTYRTEVSKTVITTNDVEVESYNSQKLNEKTNPITIVNLYGGINAMNSNFSESKLAINEGNSIDDIIALLETFKEKINDAIPEVDGVKTIEVIEKKDIDKIPKLVTLIKSAKNLVEIALIINQMTQ